MLNNHMDAAARKPHYTGIQKLNRRLGRYLQIMIVFALLFTVAGLLTAAVRASPQTAALTPAIDIVPRILALDGAGFITAGLYIIVFMPLMILGVSLAHFLAWGEKRSIIVCAVLIAMLLASYVLIVK
jgi:uncharacterized membrane protein